MQRFPKSQVIADEVKGSLSHEQAVRKNFEGIRIKLRNYYRSKEGKLAAVRIVLPKSGYLPAYERQTSKASTGEVSSDNLATQLEETSLSTPATPTQPETAVAPPKEMTVTAPTTVAVSHKMDERREELARPDKPGATSPQRPPSLTSVIPAQLDTAAAPPQRITVNVPNTSVVTYKPDDESEESAQVEPLPGPKSEIDVLPDWALKLLKIVNWFRRRQMPHPGFKFVSLKVVRVVVIAVIAALCAVFYFFIDEIKHGVKIVGIYTFAPPLVNLTSHNAADTFVPTINLAWFNYREFGDVDLPDGKGGHTIVWSPNGISTNQAAVDGHFKRLEESGVKALVWFLLADGATVNFDENGFVTGLANNFTKDYLAALALAEKHRLAIIWVLIDHEWMNYEKTLADGARLFGNAQVIEEEAKRRSFFDKALLPLLRLAPVNRNIAGWVIVNEPEVALDRWEKDDKKEPDAQALKKGYVSEAGLSSFIAEAVRLIKANTSRQPVSVGHRDLESLLDFQSRHSGIALDFLVFHHYQGFTPPPVARIRERLGGADQRPIYLGEFNLNLDDPSKPRPVADVRQFVGWGRALGYAGLWPWALNPSSRAESRNEEQGQLRFQDIAGASDAVKEFRRTPPGLDDCVWLAQIKNDIKWLEDVQKNLARDLEQYEQGIRDNQGYYRDTDERLKTAIAERERERRVHMEAVQVHEKNKAALPEQEPANKHRLEAAVSDAEQWVKNATADLARREREIRNQEGHLVKSQQRLGAHTYLARKTALRAALLNPLYLDYWRSEEKRLSPNCR